MGAWRYSRDGVVPPRPGRVPHGQKWRNFTVIQVTAARNAACSAFRLMTGTLPGHHTNRRTAPARRIRDVLRARILTGAYGEKPLPEV
jgi:hypothetical protein